MDVFIDQPHGTVQDGGPKGITTQHNRIDYSDIMPCHECDKLNKDRYNAMMRRTWLEAACQASTSAPSAP
jgi:hypothetical protein